MRTRNVPSVETWNAKNGINDRTKEEVFPMKIESGKTDTLDKN